MINKISSITTTFLVLSLGRTSQKNIERHRVDTKTMGYSSYFRFDDDNKTEYIYILSIITREMRKLKTYSPTYFIMDNGENMLNLTHTLDKTYLTDIL